MTFSVDDIVISVKLESNRLRLTTGDESYLLANQTFDEIKTIVETNYRIVKAFFQPRAGTIVSSTDLGKVTLQIVLYYFFMYNHWRDMYPREQNRDLTFLQKDFEDSNIDRIVIEFFQKKYPDNYADKCEALLQLNPDELQECVKRKEQFDNK